MTILRAFVFILLVLLPAAAPASAQAGADQDIEAARIEGVIGERIDGYLGIVTSADAGLLRKVQDINNRRRAVYEQTALETGATVQQVARIAGERQIALRVQPGEYYMNDDGAWIRK